MPLWQEEDDTDPRATPGDPQVDLGWDQPPYLVDQRGNDARYGIAIDDSCYVVLLCGDLGRWIPVHWIPPYVARRLGELADLEVE